MKQREYTKAVLEKVDENKEITCDGCGNKGKIGHAIVDHTTDTVKVVCDECFKAKYGEGLYPRGKH